MEIFVTVVVSRGILGITLSPNAPMSVQHEVPHSLEREFGFYFDLLLDFVKRKLQRQRFISSL